MFGAVKLIKNIDFNEHKYSGYGIGFDGKETNSIGNGCGKVCVTFGVEMSSTMHVDNKKKDIAILREGLSKGLDGTKLTAEKKHSINFAENNKTFCLPLHYNGANSYLLVDDTGIIKFTAKYFEIVETTLFLGNYWQVYVLSKVQGTGFVWNLSTCECNKLLDIGQYLDYKNCRKKLFW